ncbi:MAG: hypothetical protein ACRC8C_03070 [Mycoplasmoidaceae bacterium]
MSKNLKIIILINLLVIIILLFFYKINIYCSGEKIVTNDGRVFLIFFNQDFEKKIMLLNNNNEMSFYIENIYTTGNYKIYEINDELNSIENVVAIKEKIPLIKYIIRFI